MGLDKRESRIYARAMKRLEVGYWGYPLSLFREVTLTTREGDDNRKETANKHLKILVDSFRIDGYGIEYCGVWLPTPGKGLMHWHGFWRIKGGYFLCDLEKTADIAAKEVRKRWMRIHNAYQVDFDVLFSEDAFSIYLSKHVLKGFIEERARLNFSKGWTREGLNEALKSIEYFVSKGRGRWYISSSGWKLFNEIEKAFCCGENKIWRNGNLRIWVHEYVCELFDMSVGEFEEDGK